MSAIAGIVRWDGKHVSNPLLDAMRSAMQHRNADATAIWCDGPAGLVHLASHITLESQTERVPYQSRETSLVVTADARLDNRDDLIAALAIANRHAGDAEIILAAYEKWAEDCAQHLIGDFAFVIWDPARRQAFGARDAMGVKPFYYFESRDCLAFGSEMKAVLQVPEVPRRLNETTVGDYLCHTFEDSAITFYRDIRRLPPGSWLKAAGGQTTIRAYWKPDPLREIRLASEREYTEAFLDVFREAVRCRLRSEQPVGSTLSGGLDSSSIACAGRNLLRESGEPPLQTFSAIFPGMPEKALARIDERKYISAVVNMGGISPHYVEADRISPLTDFARILQLCDQPVLSPNLYMHRALYSAARQNGVRVMLDGLDGDTTVSYGLDYLRQLLVRGRWVNLAKEAGALSRQYDVTRASVLWRFAMRPTVPEPLVRVWRSWRGVQQPELHGIDLLNGDFAQRIGLVERLRSAVGRQPFLPRSAREIHLEGIRSPLMTYALEMADSSAAAFGLEPRYPFFDRRLIEFSLALPLSQKLSRGWTRVVLRRAMEGILPPEVQWRTGKGDLSPHFTNSLLQAGRPALERTLQDDAALIEPYLNLSALRQMLDRGVNASQKSAADAVTLFGVMMFSNWLREAKVSH